MDMSKNFIPDDVRRVHLMAVCGTAMGALACMLKNLGCEVTGSDQKVYPPMSDFLAGRGIRIMDGFRPEKIAHGRVDLLIGARDLVAQVREHAGQSPHGGAAHGDQMDTPHLRGDMVFLHVH